MVNKKPEIMSRECEKLNIKSTNRDASMKLRE